MQAPLLHLARCPAFAPLPPPTPLLTHLRCLCQAARSHEMDLDQLGDELDQVLDHMEQGRAGYSDLDPTSEAMEAYLHAVCQIGLCLVDEDPAHLDRGLGMAEQADIDLQTAMDPPPGAGISFQVRSRVELTRCVT